MGNEQEQTSLKNVCVNGEMEYPRSWTSDAKFMYSNKVAFGQTCDEHYVEIEGESRVSEEQKKYSQISEESIECQRESVSEEKYRVELSNCRDSEWEKKEFLEKKHSEAVEKKLKSCEKKRHQSVSLDQTVFTVTYSQSLPKELREIVPLVSGQSPLEQSYKALTGEPLYGKCVLGEGFVQSFDRKTYNYHIDECVPLITSDCSKDQEHAVLAKEVNGLKHITIFESRTKIELRPTEAYQNFVEDWTCEVNGQKIQLKKNEMKT